MSPKGEKMTAHQKLLLRLGKTEDEEEPEEDPDYKWSWLNEDIADDERWGNV